jgi:hypothetical protein
MNKQTKQAVVLRDMASRRLTGREFSLCAAVADGIHLDASGEWISDEDRKVFESLVEKHEEFFRATGSEVTA